MSLFATERVPQPVVMTGVVGTDLAGRTLTVRLSELASGYERLHWRTAHRALRRAEETGWRTGRTVWASAPGSFRSLLWSLLPMERWWFVSLRVSRRFRT
jgi:hypothetical protein